MNTPNQILARALAMALALCLVRSGEIRAQDAGTSQPEYILLTFTHVKPDRVAEFERLQKEELNPALKKAGVTMRLASTRAVVGEGYQYVFGTPLQKFAELDEASRFDRFADLDRNRLRDHMGADAYGKLLAKRPTSAIVRIERTLARHRTDLSIVPDPKTTQAK